MNDEDSARPLLFNKDLGRALPEVPELPAANADGLPVVPLTQEQKFVFDARGWLLVEGVLEEDEIEAMRDFCYRLKREPELIEPAQRSTYGGPLQRLTDHPVVVGFCNEFLATPYLASESCYGFRMEMSFLALRSAADQVPFEFAPHNGSGMFRLPGDCHTYHCIPGKAQCGLTRAVWELNDVDKGDGGTLFLTGSHKSAYAAPDTARRADSPLWDTYACKAGSVVFFTEALSHSGQPWTCAERDRVAVFNAYNQVNTRWTLSQPHPQLLESMPAQRQTLFRDAYTKGNVVGQERGAHY